MAKKRNVVRLSLNARVLIAASAILASFFGLAGITLDRAYYVSAESVLKERLQGQIYALIASAVIDDQGRVHMPDEWRESRVSIVGPDLYAQIYENVRNKVLWQSPLLEDVNLRFASNLQRNERAFGYSSVNTSEEFATFSFGVAWDDKSHKQVFTFSVAENLEGFNRQVAAFRRNLWGSLGGVALLLLAVQGLIMRWGLAPLNQAADEIGSIKAGNSRRLSQQYPNELKALTDNINALIVHQEEHLERYRHTLGDLAHSLKTPLAILQSALDKQSLPEAAGQTVQEQLDRMVQITEYQLQRAATAGQTPLLAPLIVNDIVLKVINGLKKVYADKHVTVDIVMPDTVLYHGDAGDLMEVIGNLCDNAFKWCAHKITVRAAMRSSDNIQSSGLHISIEDDGPGIPEEMVERVVQRGVRADQATQGHGIGLSIVQDITQIYGGQLSIAANKKGGALLQVWLPDAA